MTTTDEVSSIIVAKIGDLPRYCESIVEAIRANPGKRAKALAAILLSNYGVKVDWNALLTYIDRNKLYDIASQSPCTPIRGTGAPTTPTGASMQVSPIRASPRKTVYAKLDDLGRYKHRIVEAIKANPGKGERALSSVLKTSYALVVHYKTLKKFCDEHKLWDIKPDAPTPSRVLSGKRKIGGAIGRCQDDCFRYAT